MKKQIEKNSPKAWLLAARPKTLMGAAVPMMVVLAKALADVGSVDWVPATLCVLFAMLMQIDANFINDYFDFRRGNDDETRLGPRRACAEGWVAPQAMLAAIGLTTAMACLAGLPLVWYGGWEMVAVGGLCVLFCFLYTTTLSYWGMGDLLVLVFFGLVPVCASYFILVGTLTAEVVCLALACGLVIDTLLIVNNFRDIDNDRRAGKWTLVVRIGARGGLWLYFGAGLAGALLAVATDMRLVWFALPYLFLHIVTGREMGRIGRGKALNLILGQTARNMFVFGLLTAVGVLLLRT